MNLLTSFLSLIERTAFKVPSNNLQSLNMVNELILHPFLFIPYLYQELLNAFSFNLIYFLLFLLYLPQNLPQSLICDPWMGFWLLSLCLLNTCLVLPKLLLIWKLRSLGLDEDRINLSRGLWLFVRCNAFELNAKISKGIFVLHLFGLLRLGHINTKACEESQIYLYSAISFSFVLRVGFSLLSFKRTFSKENLEREEGLSLKQLKGLKINELERDFKEKYHGQEFCSICLEEFKEKESIRVIECPGRHIYHVECIDKWLGGKKTCPNCNYQINNNNRKSI